MIHIPKDDIKEPADILLKDDAVIGFQIDIRTTQSSRVILFFIGGAVTITPKDEETLEKIVKTLQDKIV